MSQILFQGEVSLNSTSPQTLDFSDFSTGNHHIIDDMKLFYESNAVTATVPYLTRTSSGYIVLQIDDDISTLDGTGTNYIDAKCNTGSGILTTHTKNIVEDKVYFNVVNVQGAPCTCQVIITGVPID